MQMLAVPLALAAALAAPPSAPVQDADESLPAVVRQRRSRLERDSLFSKLLLERVERDGHVWLVQMRHGDEESRIERALARLTPWFERCEELFDAEVAGPAGYDELGERLPVATVVMASKGDFMNYVERKTWQCPAGIAAIYDPYLALTVTWDEPALGSEGRPHGRWGSRLHAWVHALQQAYARIPERICGPYWIDEGVAHHLAPATPLVVDELAAGADRDRMRARLARTALDGGHEIRYLMRFDELFDQRDLSTAGTWVQEESAGAQEAYEAYWSRMGSLSLESGALVAFLLDRENGRRGGFLRYLRSCATGRGKPAHLREALGLDEEGMRALEVEFWRECIESRRGSGDEAAADTSPARGIPSVVREAFGLATGRHPGADTALGGRAWAELGVRGGDPSQRLSLALSWGARGNFGAAAELLAETVASMPESAERAELERFRGRLRGIADEARAELEARVASGESLRLRLPDGWVRAPLKEIEGDRVRLGRNRKNAHYVPIDGELRMTLARAALDEAIDPERRERLAFLHALRDDRRAGSVAEEVGGDRGERLRTDLGTVEDSIAAAAVLEPLDALSRFDGVGGPSREAALQRIGALVGEHGEDPLVHERLDLLRMLAKQILLQEWDAARAIESLNPTRHLIDRGLLHLTYELESPDELRDFELLEDYSEFFEGVAEDVTLDPSRWGRELTEGAYELRGFQVLQHRMHFRGASESRIRFRYEADAEARIVGLYLTSRDDGTGDDCLVTSQGHSMELVRGGFGVADAGDVEQQVSFADKTYEVVLSYDGEDEATLQSQGEIVGTLDVGELAPGTTTVVLVSDWTCRVDSIELRGEPDVEASVGLRDEWLARELGDLGFGSAR